MPTKMLIMKTFEETIEEMSREEFVALLDEFKEFENVGMSIDEYLSNCNEI